MNKGSTRPGMSQRTKTRSKQDLPFTESWDSQPQLLSLVRKPPTRTLTRRSTNAHRRPYGYVDVEEWSAASEQYTPTRDASAAFLPYRERNILLLAASIGSDIGLLRRGTHSRSEGPKTAIAYQPERNKNEQGCTVLCAYFPSGQQIDKRGSLLGKNEKPARY